MARGSRTAAGLIVAAALALTGCSTTPPGGTANAENTQQADSAGGKPVIGVAAIDLTNPFFVGMRKAGNQAAKDYGVKTIWQSAEGSVEQEVSIVENYINQGVDAILIDPLDRNALKPVIAQATQAGIPVVTMGNKVDGKGNYNTLYPDAENMAMVARAAATAMGGNGKMALLVGARGNYVSDTREQAFRRTIEEEFPKVKLVSVQPTDFDARKAANITETLLTTYPELELVACISDSLCLAAKQVATARGEPNLKIAGHDGADYMHEYLKNGSMVLDVLTGAGRVGYWNIAVGARLAKGADLPRNLFMRTYFVTTDSTAKHLRQKGLQFDYVTPSKATQLATSYAEEFGPDQPDSAMTIK